MIVDNTLTYKTIKTYVFELKDFKDEFERYELHLEFADSYIADLFLYHTKKKFKMKLSSVVYYTDDEHEVIYNVVQKLLKNKEKTIEDINEQIAMYEKEFVH